MTAQPFALPAAILFVIALPIVLGLVPRNRFYGVRTRRTLSSDAVWYATNRLAGAGIAVASVVYAAVALAWPYDPAGGGDPARWALHLVAFVAPLAASLGVALWYARRL